MSSRIAAVLTSATTANERAAAFADLEHDVEEYRASMKRLRDLGRPTVRLADLIDEAERTVYAHFLTPLLGAQRASQADVTRAMSALAAEVSRLKRANSVFVDDLLDGILHHRDSAHNARVLDELRVLSVRSGGFIEPPSDDMLRRHYAAALKGVRTMDEFAHAGLKLWLEDYAPAAVLNDPGLVLAPETVELVGPRKACRVRVAYGVQEVGFEPVPVGTITVPLAVYERNAHSRIARSKFPKLPHGIRLVVSVTMDRREIAHGPLDATLAKRVAKGKLVHRRGVVTLADVARSQR